MIASGDSAAIVSKINEFRLLAGNPLNTAPGATNGRREVNWDGVPAAFTNNNSYPFDFFGSADPALGNGRKRGLILNANGSQFRVDSSRFEQIDPSYPTQFEAFSKSRLFVNTSSPVTEVSFKVPGGSEAAYVQGFGLIFSDVDDATSTTVQFYNGDKSLGLFKAPVRSGNGSFSFLGVGFPEEKVTRIKITSGNGVLAAGVKDISNGGSKDLVVMDDFIYDEPRKLQ
ncbi:MAG TPA: hypothetical protein VHK91_12790 [Flavisolibacter sp.]|nr:hypothetical protein [Flavisolibacter sp.]